MVKNIGPLNRDFPPYGEMSINSNHVTHHMDVLNFPEGKAGEACARHLQEGAAAELLGEFMISGCHFPEDNEEQIIRTAFVCPGPSSILKKCRLALLQATVEGEIITEGKITH